MDDFKQLSAEREKDLMTRALQAWKQYSARRKKSVLDLIKAYQFRYHRLFMKTIKGLGREGQLYYRLLKFRQFKRGVLQSAGDVMQNIHLVQTLRLRRNLKIMVRVHRKRKEMKHNLNVRAKYRQHKLKEKVFGLIKVSTILFRLGQKHQSQLIVKYKKRLIAGLKQLREQKTHRESRLHQVQETINAQLVSRCFNKWKGLQLSNKYLKLVAFLKKSHFEHLTKCILIFRMLQSGVARQYSQRLLRKCFDALNHNVIQLKFSKYYAYKLIERHYYLWKQATATQKNNELSVPTQTINRIKSIHHKYTRLAWFNKMCKQHQRITNNRRKSQTINEYYRLKTEEIIYRKYFNAFVEHRAICRAERYYNNRSLKRSWELFQAGIRDKQNQKMLSDKAAKFHQQRLLAKSFTILMIPIEKSRTAVQWKHLCIKKRCLQKWIQITVSDYLQAKEKAEEFYKINTSFKVLMGFRLNLEFNKKVLDVVRVRVRRCLRTWAKGHRIREHFRQRELRTKAMMFRNWKFYIKY